MPSSAIALASVVAHLPHPPTVRRPHTMREAAITVAKVGRTSASGRAKGAKALLRKRTPVSAVRAPLARISEYAEEALVALEEIEPGRLVERSPVLVIPSDQRLDVDKTIIFTYVFMWEQDTIEQDLYKHSGRSAIALGYTSLLSHSYEPNCIFVRHIDELLIDVFASRTIGSGEELTIDYQMELWFDPVRIDSANEIVTNCDSPS
jgi:hypothetical protein